MLNERDRILTRLIAREDATRLPIRDWRSKLPTNRFVRAAELAAHGLAFRAEAADADEQKRVSRALQKLSDDRLVRLRRRPRVKYPNVAVTDAGDARARALAGLPGLVPALNFLAELVDHSAELEPRDGVRWVPEIAFTDGKGWGDGKQSLLIRIEERFLFPARRGWATCRSSFQGNVLYAATAVGLSLPDHPPVFPRTKLPAADGDAIELYDRELKSAIRALANEIPDRPGELGELPAPTSWFATAAPQSTEPAATT